MIDQVFVSRESPKVLIKLQQIKRTLQVAKKFEHDGTRYQERALDNEL